LYKQSVTEMAEIKD